MFKKNIFPKLKVLSSTKTLGARGEDEATKYLQNKGYSVPIRNWKIKYGEIDLIAIHNNKVVFVEVKTRYDSPIARTHLFDNISSKKKRKLITLASIFADQHWKGRKRPDYRIDVIGVLINRDNESVAKIIHLEGVL